MGNETHLIPINKKHKITHFAPRSVNINCSDQQIQHATSPNKLKDRCTVDISKTSFEQLSHYLTSRESEQREFLSKFKHDTKPRKVKRACRTGGKFKSDQSNKITNFFFPSHEERFTRDYNPAEQTMTDTSGQLNSDLTVR